MDTNPKHPLEQAVRILGGQFATATALGVHPSLVSQWVNRVREPESGKGRPLPPERCPAIERLTGIRCEQLLPDIVWTRNTSGEVTGYHVPLAAAS